MFYLRLALTALRSLDSHFLRSLLATLGVLIGVGSVVACMSILEGFSNDIAKRFKSLGSNLLYIHPTAASVEGRPVGLAQTLTLEDVRLLKRELADQIDTVAPECTGSATIKYFQNSYPRRSIANRMSTLRCTPSRPSTVKCSIRPTEDEGGGRVSGSQDRDKLFGGWIRSVRPSRWARRLTACWADGEEGSLGFRMRMRRSTADRSGAELLLQPQWLPHHVGIKDATRLEEVQKQVCCKAPRTTFRRRGR